MTEIYTDGACEPNPGPGSWAFVVVRDRRRHICVCRTLEDPMNFQMSKLHLVVASAD